MSSRPSAVESSRGGGDFEKAKAGGKEAGSMSGGEGSHHRSHESGVKRSRVSSDQGSHRQSGAEPKRSGVGEAGSKQRSHAPGAGRSPALLVLFVAVGASVFLSMKAPGASWGWRMGVGALAGLAVLVLTRPQPDQKQPDQRDGEKKVWGKKHDGKFDHVHIYALLDSSGSMSKVEDGVIQGYNKFVEDMKALKEQGIIGYFTLVQFSSYIDYNPLKVSIDKQKIKDLRPGFLTKYDPENNPEGTYRPNGGTPLYDAWAKLIERAADQKNSTEAVNIFVFTDAELNEEDSTECDEAQLKALIEEKKQEEGWRFSFLAAKQDAHAFADKFGLGADSAQNLSYDADGFKTGWESMSQSISKHYGKRNDARDSSRSRNLLEAIPESGRC